MKKANNYQQPFERHLLYVNSSKAKKLLIADDDYIMRKLLCENAKNYFQILEAENGSQALEIFSKEEPDAIVSDFDMPMLNGVELCSEVRKLKSASHVPFIIHTSHINTEERIKGYHYGIDDYFDKPCDVDLLIHRILSLITQRQRVKQEIVEKIAFALEGKYQMTSEDDLFISKSIKLIETNIHNPNFTVGKLAEELNTSISCLYRKTLKLTGVSPCELIKSVRLEFAALLLKKRVGNVAEIAYQTGFHNLSYFSKCFKEKFGTVPSRYSLSVAA